MKTITKISLAAVTLALSSTAFADDQKLVLTDNGHGGLRYHYRTVESAPTIAVFVNERSVGQRTVRTDVRTPELRFALRDTGHGSVQPHYVAMK
jgi:hypothetical protein